VVSKLLGINRGTVLKILKGEKSLAPGEHTGGPSSDAPRRESVATHPVGLQDDEALVDGADPNSRCPHCGAKLLVVPCRACRLLATQAGATPLSRARSNYARAGRHGARLRRVMDATRGAF
jgi:hypothetical protein